MNVRDLLSRNPDRPIETVIRITDRDPQRVWVEMDEYVPTDRVKGYFRDIMDALLETRQGATERVCIWISGFFGSGKSHFLKALGYLLQDEPLSDPQGCPIRSQRFLCEKLGLQNYLPILQKEFRPRVLFINLLNYDVQSPDRPTLSRLIYQALLQQEGFSTTFWVAAWEQELKDLGRWETFNQWVQQEYRRSWEEERKMNAEAILRRALPALLPERYPNEETAASALHNSQRVHQEITPSQVAGALRQYAESADPQGGRTVVLLDEVGLYIGEDLPRLTDLKSLAEQVVQQGEGKILLVATAQEALTDLVPKLTRDREILQYLRDRFRLAFLLEPTDVPEVVARRLLEKTPQGDAHLRKILSQHQGALRAALSLTTWQDDEFIQQYPCHPYAVRLIQDIQAGMRGSIEEQRRLSRSERSLLKLVHAILRGEGGILQGADQPIGWLIGLDLFYDALRGDLETVRSEQVRAMEEIARLGEADGMPVARVAKALFLLQQVAQRYPCTPDHIAAALVDHVDADLHRLRAGVEAALRRLQQEGWAVEEGGQYRLLTPVEHDLERDVRQNYPSPAEVQARAAKLARDLLRSFRYEHGQIRRQIPVSIGVDDEGPAQEADLRVHLFTPFTDKKADELLARSVAEPETLFWPAGEVPELRPALERALAVQRTLDQWRTRPAGSQQAEEHRARLEREVQQAFDVRLPELMRRAFLQGRMFHAGQELSLSGDSLDEALRGPLSQIAQKAFTEFVDARPERDDDCAAILSWQPGGTLPPFYARLNLVVQNQINGNQPQLVILKKELQRRRNQGLDRSGRALADYFERQPYGWDGRLVRALLATLFKAGLLSVRYQNRDLTDPTDAQARAIFSQTREFKWAIFELLQEVDWRALSDRCSTLFGVPGGDTFERTAETVLQKAREWEQTAAQLEARCRDNELPHRFADACQKAADILNGLAAISDPNVRLRRFEQEAQNLGEVLPIIFQLKDFPFDRYRQARRFASSAGEWARTLAGDDPARWQNFVAGLNADDLPARWKSLEGDLALFRNRYASDYLQRHARFQEAVREALDALKVHEAFQHNPSNAEVALKKLSALACSAELSSLPDGQVVCTSCGRSYDALNLSQVISRKREVEAELDRLLPRPRPEHIQPLTLTCTVQEESEIDNLADELRRYIRRAGRPVRLNLHAEAEEK
jgi:hypothetical protein